MNKPKTLGKHERHLSEMLLNTLNNRDPKWKNSAFEPAKLLSTTEKSNVAEDFAVYLGKHYGYSTERHEKRRGPWDVKIGTQTIEVKSATEDIQNKFQFNGIRYDNDYDLLMVIGISPGAVLFDIFKKEKLLKMTLVSMAKGTSEGNGRGERTQPTN